MNEVTRWLSEKYTIASHQIALLGHARLGKKISGSWADHVDYMPLNIFSGCSLISLYPIVLFGFLLLVLTWWRFVPRPIVPRRDLGPRVCSRHAIVPLGARRCLSACGWNYIDTSQCNVGIVFPLPLFFKGVGPWGSKNANGVFYMGVYKVH